MANTVSFMTRNFGKYNPSSLDSYEQIGGFSALRKALSMTGEQIADCLAARLSSAMPTRANPLPLKTVP